MEVLANNKLLLVEAGSWRNNQAEGHSEISEQTLNYFLPTHNTLDKLRRPF